MDVNKELKTICSEIFRFLSDDFLLKEVKEKIRTALRFDEDEFERFAQWWSIVSKGEQKAFVHLLVGDGRDWRDACTALREPNARERIATAILTKRIRISDATLLVSTASTSV